jgi:hypothetical protein
MNAVPHQRGLDLLAAHCAALHLETMTARERLDDLLGPELARKLVFALSGGSEHRERSRSLLYARPVFAA